MRNSAPSSEDKIGISSILLIVGAFIVAGLVLLNEVFFAKTRELIGVVQSVGYVAVGAGNGRGGGEREYSSIYLEDGSTVLARVVAGSTMSAGDTVKVLEQQRFVGPSIFQVVSIEHQP